MEKRKRGKSLLSLSTILASFFGAAMIAGAFAYFNYKFSEYKFIDFKKWIFYEKSDLFTPEKQKYLVVFYSSKQKDSMRFLADINISLPILAFDYYNKVSTNTNTTTFLRSGTNTSLKFIQRFNLYNAPSIFLLKQQKNSLYKQDSMIHPLQSLQDLIYESKNL